MLAALDHVQLYERTAEAKRRARLTGLDAGEALGPAGDAAGGAGSYGAVVARTLQELAEVDIAGKLSGELYSNGWQLLLRRWPHSCATVCVKAGVATPWLRLHVRAVEACVAWPQACLPRSCRTLCWRRRRSWHGAAAGSACSRAMRSRQGAAGP
jgi:hypothetical protein